MIRFPVQRRWWVMVVLYLAAAASSRGAVVKFEAEAGVLGAGWTNGVEGVIQFISTATNAAGNYPSDDFRVATYTVNFPAAGTYDLFVRLRVGAAGASDDSFFYGNGFGVKSPVADAD